MRKRTLTIELPDDVAEVDFIDHCVVTTTLIPATEHYRAVLQINVKATHGHDASSWDLHEFEVVLPEQQKRGGVR